MSPLSRSLLLASVWLAAQLCGAPGLSAQCTFPQSKEPTLTYRFTPELSPTGLILHVSLSFRSSAAGEDTLMLPTRWAGETLHALTGLQAATAATTLVSTADPERIQVRSQPNSRVTLTYDLHKDWNGPFAGQQFHPVLLPEYLEITGSNALARLKLADGVTETANFDWEQLPAPWALATSFGTTATTQNRCQTYTGAWEHVANALFAAGDFRIHSFAIAGRPAYLAIRGSWPFPDQEAIADIQKVVGRVRSFWHDNDFPYFLVTLAPYDQNTSGSDGSAFTNAFWMFLPPHGSLTPLLPQLAHESFHAWDPERMGIEPAGYNESFIKWFREGPTDYYAHLFTYLAGELSAQEYIATLNNLLLRFPDSDDEYVRGPILSLWLDGTIRAESKEQSSLDNIMYDMVRTADQPYTLDHILNVIDPYLSPASRQTLRRAITQHGEVPAPALLPVLGDCAHASLDQVPTFDLGFNAEVSLTTHRLSGVVQDGPAFRAGLREGQPLIHLSFYRHDPSREARVTVHTEDADHVMTFLPQGKPVQAWQYHLDEVKPCSGSPR